MQILVLRVLSDAAGARPTCVPTCSLSTGVVATSVASATVLMKVQYDTKKLCHPKHVKCYIKLTFVLKKERKQFIY